ncbi:MAG: signal peptidase I [Candidatus Azambacteria bacterium]|nr:signal peptidase I [Candidatus Azambacteria bacterium]
MNFLKSVFKFSWDIIKVAVIALILAGLVRYFLIQPFFVEGASMEPNFENGEYLLIDEVSYYFRSIERGEVIVFHYPLDTSKYYIKRIIGLPNETVEIKNGKVVIYNNTYPDGFAIDENYLPKNFITNGQIKKKLGNGEYFVLGDNRLVSSDSRYWGVLPKNDIVGRVWIRAWPINRASIFSY